MEIITIILLAIVFYLIASLILHKVVVKVFKVALFAVLSLIAAGIVYFLLK